MSEERIPTEQERRVFLRAAKQLAKLGKAGLWMYAHEDTLHLMTGPSHDEGWCNSQVERQDRIVESVHIPKFGGGGW